jgi:hypothetical protein
MVEPLVNEGGLAIRDPLLQPSLYFPNVVPEHVRIVLHPVFLNEVQELRG